MLDGYYYCLNCHSEITPDYNEHCTFCGCSAVAVSEDYSPEEVEAAFDLLNKKQQGLVLVLPCKVGTPVFIVNKEGGYIHPGLFRIDDLPRFGRRVFLNKKKAEAALKAK